MSTTNHLYQPKPKSFRIGGDIRHKKDVTRFVRWPKYVRLQREKKILSMRLKVPPAINQLSNTLNKNQTAELMKLLEHYQPETDAAKKARLTEQAKAKAEKKTYNPPARPNTLTFGINEVTHAIESKKAKLVVIAHDVDPIELIVWLPALCRKMEVPYCIVGSQARLGQLVHLKHTTCVALTSVNKEDESKLGSLTASYRTMYNESGSLRKWGGGLLGIKTQNKLRKRENAIKKEIVSKA